MEYGEKSHENNIQVTIAFSTKKIRQQTKKKKQKDKNIYLFSDYKSNTPTYIQVTFLMKQAGKQHPLPILKLFFLFPRG